MAKIAGRLMSVTTDATAINGVVDASLNMENDELDTSTHDGGQWRSFILGRSSATLDLSLLWDESDTGQAALMSDFLNQTSSEYVILMQTSSGLDRYTADGYITSCTPSGPNDDVAAFDVTIRLTGSVVLDAQP